MFSGETHPFPVRLGTMTGGLVFSRLPSYRKETLMKQALCIVTIVSLFLALTSGVHATWNWQNLNPVPADTDLDAVWISESGEFIAVGEDGLVIHWDGSGWNTLDVPADESLKAVWGTGSDVFIAGDGGVILRGDGETWTRMNSGTDETLVSIWGTSSRNMYAAGDNRLLHFDGTGWKQLAFNPGFAVQLLQIWGFDENTIYLLVIDRDANRNRIFKGDGTTWEMMPEGTGGAVRSLCGNNPDDLYAAGYVTRMVTFVGLVDFGTIWHWNGNTWSEIYSDPGYFSDFHDIHADGSGDIHAVGSYNIVYWNGAAWSEEKQPPYSIRSIHGTGPDNLISVGCRGLVYSRTGMEWNLLSDGFRGRGFLSMWGISDQEIYLADWDTFLKWDGSALSTMPGIPQGWVRGLWGTDSENIYGVAETTGNQGGLMHWDGETWSYSPVPAAGNLFDLWGFDDQNIFVAGENGFIGYWNGGEWIVMPSGTTQTLWAIWGTSANRMFAAGDNGTVLYFDGDSWNPITTDSSCDFKSIRGTVSGDVWLCGNIMADYTSRIYRLNDGNWTEEHRADSLMYALAGTEADNMFALGMEIFHRDSDGWCPVQLPVDFNSSTCGWVSDTGNLYTGERLSRFRRLLPMQTGSWIDIPGCYIRPGDCFHVHLYLDNAGSDILNDTNIFCILDIHGILYFWPEWTGYNPPAHAQFDWMVLDVPPGSTGLEIIPPFTWPDTGTAFMEGLVFYGAMVDPGMTHIIGDLGMVCWGFGR
jgi:hypothetical protein